MKHTYIRLLRLSIVDNASKSVTGVMGLKEAETKDGYDVQMQTNHLSHFLLVSLLMPALERAALTFGEARIVAMTSGARNVPPTPIDVLHYQKAVGQLGGDAGGAERYHQSKLANSAFIFCLLYTSPSPRDQRGSRMPSSA